MLAGYSDAGIGLHKFDLFFKNREYKQLFLLLLECREHCPSCSCETVKGFSKARLVTPIYERNQIAYEFARGCLVTPPGAN